MSSCNLSVYDGHFSWLILFHGRGHMFSCATAQHPEGIDAKKTQIVSRAEVELGSSSPHEEDKNNRIKLNTRGCSIYRVIPTIFYRVSI